MIELHNNNRKKQTIKFKIIQAESPLTFERINIGIMIEQEKDFTIKFVENVDMYASVFPMYSTQNLKDFKRYIKMKSKRKKITSQAKKITSYVNITETKLLYTDKPYHYVINELFEQYITLYKTNRYINQIYQLIKYREGRLDELQQVDEKINIVSLKHTPRASVINILNDIKNKQHRVLECSH